MKELLTPAQAERIIEMAWEDHTPFEAIKAQFGLPESKVIALMRNHLARPAWRRWRKRVQGRSTKHAMKRPTGVGRFKCTRQRSISANKIAKRQGK